MAPRQHDDSTRVSEAARAPGPACGTGPCAVGRHEVTRLLGAGGMGDVYAVRDPRLGREVAAKLIRGTATAATAARFHREARITGALEHPGIVPLYELGTTDDGHPYFTMRKVQGATLRQRLEGARPPDLAAKLAIFARVCEALAYAHTQGVIHRDLKPDNIMTGPFGEVYVMDWGLARELVTPGDGVETADCVVPAPPPGDSDSGTAEGTQDGAVVGTPAFMSPEQAAGRVADLDVRSDVYALGAILYVLLCGKPPYDGPTPWAVIAQVLEGPPPAPSRRSPPAPVPWELEAVAMRALASARDDRYPSVTALHSDIEAYVAGRMVGAVRYSVLGALGKWVAAHRVVLGAAAAVALAAITVAGTFALRDRRARFDAIARARANLIALDPSTAIEAARRVPLAADPADRVLPPAGELSSIAELSTRIQDAVRAAADWARVAPDDAEAVRWRCALLLALGRLAEARLEDGNAASAYQRAAALAADDGTAARLAARAAGAAAARREQRAKSIAARLADADAGDLDDESAFVSAVAELASYRETQTLVALVAEVDDGTVRLLRGARAAYATAGATPTLADRLAHARLDPTATELTRDERRTLAALQAALVLREQLTSEPIRPSASAIVARHQELALDEGRASGGGRLKLACAVLGRLDDATGSIAPLVRLAWADEGGRHALAAGTALALLARRSRDAERALLGLIGLTEDQVRWRYDMNGPFWTQVGRELVRARRQAHRAEETADRSAPLSAREWNRRGIARMSVGDDQGAGLDFSKAIELDATLAEAYLNRGCIRERQGDNDGAIADQTRAIELLPTTAEAWMNRGNARRAARDLDGALADLSRAIELAPMNAMARVNRGNVHRLRADLASAHADFDRAHELDPQFAGALVACGQARAAQKDHARAIADYSQAIVLDPRDAEALALRAESRYQVDDYSGAVADADKAVALEPRGATGRLTRANARLALGDSAGAIPDLNHLLRLDPANTHVLGLRGGVRLSLSDVAGATADLSRAIELGTTHAEVYVNRSTARQYGRDLAGALADVNRALEMEPTLAVALSNRAGLLRALGQADLARGDVDRAIDLDPGSVHAWRMRAEMRTAAGDVVGAISDLDHALTLEPNDAQTLRSRGGLRGVIGLLDLAVADLDAAIALSPEDWDALMKLGVVHHHRGDHARSAAAFRRALEVAPDHRRAVIEAARSRLPKR